MALYRLQKADRVFAIRDLAVLQGLAEKGLIVGNDMVFLEAERRWMEAHTMQPLAGCLSGFIALESMTEGPDEAILRLALDPSQGIELLPTTERGQRAVPLSGEIPELGKTAASSTSGLWRLPTELVSMVDPSSLPPDALNRNLPSASIITEDQDDEDFDASTGPFTVHITIPPMQVVHRPAYEFTVEDEEAEDEARKRARSAFEKAAREVSAVAEKGAFATLLEARELAQRQPGEPSDKALETSLPPSPRSTLPARADLPAPAPARKAGRWPFFVGAVAALALGVVGVQSYFQRYEKQLAAERAGTDKVHLTGAALEKNLRSRVPAEAPDLGTFRSAQYVLRRELTSAGVAVLDVRLEPIGADRMAPATDASADIEARISLEGSTEEEQLGMLGLVIGQYVARERLYIRHLSVQMLYPDGDSADVFGTGFAAGKLFKGERSVATFVENLQKGVAPTVINDEAEPVVAPASVAVDPGVSPAPSVDAGVSPAPSVEPAAAGAVLPAGAAVGTLGKAADISAPVDGPH